MKKTNIKLSINKKHLALIVLCLIIVATMIFTLVACSKDETNPQNFSSPDEQTTPSDETPQSQDEDGEDGGKTDDGGEQNPDDKQGEGEEDETPEIDQKTQDLLDFFASVSLDDKNATTTITVSFGGKVLSRKSIEYVRTQDGGTVTTETTTLGNASDKNPYKTERSDAETLDNADFEAAFPSFKSIDVEFVKTVDYRLTKGYNTSTFLFSVEPAILKSVLDLESEDAENIASNVSVLITVGAKTTFKASYKSSNGNSVEIAIEYEQAV